MEIYFVFSAFFGRIRTFQLLFTYKMNASICFSGFCFSFNTHLFNSPLFGFRMKNESDLIAWRKTRLIFPFIAYTHKINYLEFNRNF